MKGMRKTLYGKNNSTGVGVTSVLGTLKAVLSSGSGTQPSGCYLSCFQGFDFYLGAFQGGVPNTI